MWVKMKNNRKVRNGIILLITIVFVAYPFYSAFVSGVFSWHVSQWVFWKDFIELIIYFTVAFCGSYFCREKKGYIILILFSTYLLSTGTFFQCLVSYIYIEILSYIGESFLRLFRGKYTYSIGVNFCTGTIIWGVVAILMSLLKFGTINELRIMTVLMLILAIANPINRQQKNKKILVVEYCRYLNKIDMKELAINLFFVLVMMISCARVNTYVESDSSWYALYTEKNLFGNNSFFDFLGYTEFVYYYPKFKELLMAPITGLGMPGYQISANLWIMVLCLIEVIRYIQKKTKKDKKSILCIVFLLFSTVCIVGVSGTAKSDTISYLYMILLVIYMDLFFERKEQNYLWIALSAGIMSYTVKYTSYLFATIILFISFGYIAYNLLKRNLKIKKVNSFGIILLILSALVLFGITYRTILLTGYPTYRTAKGIWDMIGLCPKPYFDIDANYKPDSVFLPIRLFYTLFDVGKAGKIQTQWIGNYLVLYFIMYLLMSNKVKKENSYIKVLSVVLIIVSIYYLVTMSAPDGNYFSVPIIVATMSLFISITRCRDWIIARRTFMIITGFFLILNFAFVFVTHPSWGTATRFNNDPIALYKTEKDNFEQKEQAMKNMGVYEIEENLKEQETPLFIIADGPAAMGVLDARIDLADMLFNRYVSGADIHNYDDFIEYINYIGVDGFIISNTDSGQAEFEAYVKEYIEINGYNEQIDTNQYIYYRIK